MHTYVNSTIYITTVDESLLSRGNICRGILVALRVAFRLGNLTETIKMQCTMECSKMKPNIVV